MEPLISVIIVTYNREKYLKIAIDSVLTQTYSNIQLIVVDDGSEDNTAKMVREIEDPRVEYYSMDQNRHIASATNYGLKQVRGEYIAILDSDDLFVPEKLQKQMDFLQQNPKYKICFTKPTTIDENGIPYSDQQYNSIFDVENMPQEQWIRRFFFHNNCLAHPSVVIEKSVINDIGGYNPAYVQLLDFDLWIRIIKKYPIYILDEPLVKIRRFSDKSENTSGATETVYIRSDNEISLIYRHFFDDMDDDLFFHAFREDFRNLQASTAIELECEKAFLFGKKGTTELMLEKLASLLDNREGRRVLEQTYHFVPKDFYRLNAELIINNQQVQRVIKQKAQDLLRIEQLEKYIVGIEEQSLTLQAENAALQAENAALQTENTVLQAENAALQVGNAALQTQNADLQEELHAVYNSTSWRFSAPVRWAGRLKSKLFGNR